MVTRLACRLSDGPVAIGEATVRLDAAGYVVEGPLARDDAREIGDRPEEIRQFVRFGEDGRYRPLSGALGIQRNWRARCQSVEELEEILEAVYPLASKHLQAQGEGRLRLVGLDDVIARQTGRYLITAELSAAGREAAAAELCARCVRTPCWRGDPATDGQIPCPEPCSLLVSLCREAAIWEQEQPGQAAPDTTIPFAAFEEPGNEVREAYLQRRTATARAERS